MSAACVCPDVEPIETISSAPLSCGCCGSPLRITCDGECGEAHVRAAFKTPVAVGKLESRADLHLSGRRSSGDSAGEKEGLAQLQRPRGNWTCGRCHSVIPKKIGRSPLYCEACLTPAELRLRDKKTAANDAARVKRNAERLGDEQCDAPRQDGICTCGIVHATGEMP